MVVFCRKMFNNTGFWGVLAILAANLMLKCILLIFKGASIASLRVLIVGLVRNAPTAILIAWWCMGSSFLSVRWLAELYTIVYFYSYYCSVC